jgi:hypothetical protein
MENAIAMNLSTEGKSTSQTVESPETKCMAAFFATEEGSAVLYEAVKKFMSTSEGVMIVENAIVAAIGSKRDSIIYIRTYSRIQ